MGALASAVCILGLSVVAAAPPAQFQRNSREVARYYVYPELEAVGDLPQLLVLLSRSASYHNDVQKAMREAAEILVGQKLAFVELRTEFSSAYKFFKFSLADLPMAVTVNWTNGFGERPYQLFLHSSGSLDGLQKDKLVQYARSFLSGELKPWLRSAPEVKDPNAYVARRGAMDIVGTQFEDLVINCEQDVLLMFYAPWCGFSKRMQPHVDDLARHLEHVRSLSVLKIDDTQNDVNHPVMKEMTGYPFLAFFPAGKKENAIHLKMKGHLLGDFPAWLENALALLRQHATHPILDKPNASQDSDPEDGLLSEEEERAEEF